MRTKFISSQMHGYLESLRQLGWTDYFLGDDQQLWGFPPGSVMPLPVTEDLLRPKYLKFPTPNKRKNEWQEFSVRKRIQLAARKFSHNLRVKSSITIAGIKIPDPEEGIAVIGSSFLHQPKQSCVSNDYYDIIHDLLYQWQSKGLRTHYPPISDADETYLRAIENEFDIDQRPVENPIAFGIGDFCECNYQWEISSLVKCKRPYIRPVIGLSRIDRKNFDIWDTLDVLSSMKTWIITSCDEQTANFLAMSLGCDFDPNMFYSLPENSFWLTYKSRNGGKPMFGKMNFDSGLVLCSS